MISVILYGRNDTYGYNLHKRAAISLNCIAEILTDPGDEMIFVDCNTPDDMPTFPEAIQDTLTPKAKRLIRILRLKPQLYEKYKKGSPLKALEPLSRNVGLRRSKLSNRWVLSTNTDMVFVVRTPEKSLSDVAAQLPGGFYELPRFEVPEALWEALNRTDPSTIIETFRFWGQRLHLNEVIISRPDIRFDGPGDFQLMLRDQVCGIHGFNEEMVFGWHVDSNLCRRLYLVNGKTDSLLDHVFSYHCEHTRQATFLHSTERTENDPNRFVFDVASPFLPDQAETWGMPDEEIEEIRLTNANGARFSNLLNTLLPGSSEPMTSDVFLTETYNHGVIYDNFHVFPFLANHLSNISPSANVGYFGANPQLLHLVTQFLSGYGYRERLMVNRELIRSAYAKELILPDQCVIADDEDMIEEADIFIFDAGMMHFPHTVNSAGVSFPAPSKEADYFINKLKSSFVKCAASERKRLQSGNGIHRKFLLIGSQGTWFEGFTSLFIGTILTPYSTHVRHGYLWSFRSLDSMSSRIKRQIIDLGFRHKSRIKKIPVLNKIARHVYRRILLSVAERSEKCPTCGARI